MKKMVLLLLTALLLTACADKEQPEKPDTTSQPESGATQQEEASEQQESEEASPSNEVQSDYVEMETVMAAVKADEYLINVETDNPNTRVFFLENQQGQKKYKSIFVKKEQRLKVIDLEQDKPVYNDILD